MKLSLFKAIKMYEEGKICFNGLIDVFFNNNIEEYKAILKEYENYKENIYNCQNDYYDFEYLANNGR